MLPQFYQKALRAHLNEKQYLTLQLLVLMLQTHRQVKLLRLADLFPQPIKKASRMRNLQRFLLLPQLTVRLLWFPIIKQWLKQESNPKKGNRAYRRALKKLKMKQAGYVRIALDRTQWKERNLLMVTLVMGQHALPIYWERIGQPGSSNLAKQKAVLKPALKLLKPYRVIVIGDREFHSPKLSSWLWKKKIDYITRQKKSAFVQEYGTEYQALKSLGFRPGMSKFFTDITVGKEAQFRPCNLAVYWKRKYRGKGPKEPWYLLTSLADLKQTLDFYRSRWGIEIMFRDYKSGGYNLENTKVNDTRLLALIVIIVIAYSLATIYGQLLQQKGITDYIGRPKESQRREKRQSDFFLALSAYLWQASLFLWSQLAAALTSLKPQKHRNFQHGWNALSVVNTTLDVFVIP